MTNTEMSITEVVNTYKNTVFGIALSHLQNKEDAEDIFQDVFLVYYRKNMTFNDEEHRKAWLIKVTLNYCKKYLAKKLRNRQSEQYADGEPFSYELELDEESEVYSALCSLPQKYRTAMHLFYLNDLPVAEIARILHMREGTVRMQLNRGREKMREKLKGEMHYE